MGRHEHDGLDEEEEPRRRPGPILAAAVVALLLAILGWQVVVAHSDLARLRTQVADLSGYSSRPVAAVLEADAETRGRRPRR